MTLEEATDILVRINTAIIALDAARDVCRGVEDAPKAEIIRALQYARDARDACKRQTS